MTAIQNQFNELLVKQRAQAETERANRAHESIQSRQAAAQTEQAKAATVRAGVEQAKFAFAKDGPLGLLSDLFTGILKAIHSK